MSARNICFPTGRNQIRCGALPAMPSDSLLFSAFPHEDYLAHKQDIDAALQQMLARGHYMLGGEVTAFEREFAERLDSSWPQKGTKGASAVAKASAYARPSR